MTWQRHADGLADALTRAGALTPGWRAAFAQTPRHIFVPHFYLDDDSSSRVDADTPAGLAAVYADESLVTQVAPHPGGGFTVPTSSSTRPSLMARMLDMLDVADNTTVLEIGTGTGYNTALLCHRLGDRQVTSVDIDPLLVETARTRLASLGYHPHLTAGDGAGGVPARAPFDRIIATAAVTAIPPTWITQLADRGRIVADIRGELASALIDADKTGPHQVRGRFHDTPGHFMWLRARAAHPLRNGTDPTTVFDFTDPEHATTDIPAAAFTDRSFRFLLQTALPDLGPISGHLPNGDDGVFLHTEDCSWIQYRPGRDTATVTYGGPRPLWPTVNDTWHRWHRWHRPTIDRYGITAHDDGRHHIWLDHDHTSMTNVTTRPPNRPAPAHVMPAASPDRRQAGDHPDGEEED
ncbi:methyltransferase domain-containing protein [Micromonospora sp. WMMA1363]|uniref:methyltransferase domain-containing protein n=1 Tax=Micromonospora sp. WMMA1363 TaxID=3053985 RepID=UPI00259D2C04|nr:methyltransferase domain-containing protein [Micromonospora sp. WMMA1363]MDM4723170.1 methyltransferase domain-containing protein [Micromonospora sp. WMMA1363]